MDGRKGGIHADEAAITCLFYFSFFVFFRKNACLAMIESRKDARAPSKVHCPAGPLPRSACGASRIPVGLRDLSLSLYLSLSLLPHLIAVGSFGKIVYIILSDAQRKRNGRGRVRSAKKRRKKVDHIRTVRHEQGNIRQEEKKGKKIVARVWPTGRCSPPRDRGPRAIRARTRSRQGACRAASFGRCRPRTSGRTTDRPRF